MIKEALIENLGQENYDLFKSHGLSDEEIKYNIQKISGGFQSVLMPRYTDWMRIFQMPDDLLERTKQSISDQIVKYDIKDQKEHTSSMGGNLIAQYGLGGHFDMEIFDWVKELCLQVVIEEDLVGEPVEFKLLDVWTVIGKQGSYHLPHSHGRDWPIDMFSATVYLTHRGDEPIPTANDDFDGVFYWISKDGDPSVNYVLPEPGKVLIYPNWIVHGTTPQGPGTRQTLNFSIGMFPKKL